ncbi:MAG: DUF3352 domain-containing protein [Myxococcota bacterium]
MKRIYPETLLSVFLVIMVSCNSCEKRKVDILSIIPQDTQNVILIPNSDNLMIGIMQFFRIFENGVAFDALKKEIDLASQKLGINLLDRNSIRDAGFDPEGSIAVISMAVNIEGKTQNTNLLIMPYSDKGRAENTLNRLSREKEKTEIFKTRSYMDAKIVTAIRQSPKGEKPVLMYAFYKGFVIYGIPPKGEIAIKKIIDTKVPNSMAKSNIYSTLKGKVKNGQMYFFINSGKNIETPNLILNGEMKKMLSSLRENFNGMMITANISNKGIVLDSYIGLSDVSIKNFGNYISRSTGEEIEKLMYIVPEEPFMIAKLSLNYTRLYGLLKEEDPYQMMIINKRIFGPMMKYMEIDVEKDILPLLKGNIIYAISTGNISNINSAIESGFKGEAFNKMFNVFYSMNLSDREKSSQLLNRFVESMKAKGQQVEEINTKGINITKSRFGAAFDSYWYIDDNNFYALYTDNKIESAIRKPDEKDKKPVFKIPQEIYGQILNPSAQVIYLSFTPVKKIIDNIDENKIGSIADTGIYKFTFILVKEVLNKLDSLLFYMLPDDNGISIDLSVNTKGK